MLNKKICCLAQKTSLNAGSRQLNKGKTVLLFLFFVYELHYYCYRTLCHLNSGSSELPFTFGNTIRHSAPGLQNIYWL